MDETCKLLADIHKNAQMGARTIEHLLTIVKDERFANQLRSQRDGYQNFECRARDELSKAGKASGGMSAMEKLRTWFMIKMDTMTDKSVAHIAEMLIIGSNMGVLDAAKRIRQYPEAKPEALDLVRSLSEFEEKNLRDLKAFL